MTGITLVLGGGGFKGLAHLGVLMVLEEAGIPIDDVIGTSAGSLVGATYCSQGSAAAARELILDFVTSDEFQKHSFAGLPGGTPEDSRTLLGRLYTGIKRQVALERMFRRSSAFGGAPLRYIARSLAPKVDIEELAKPLAIGVLDLLAGEAMLVRSGHLCSAIVASSSVPGYFPPVEREGTLLCDPGIVNNLPTDLARREGAERIVAVDLSCELLGVESDTLDMVGIDVLFRAQDITTYLGNQRGYDHADVVISPELGGRNWLDTSGLEAVVDAGADAARQALPLVRALIDERPARAG